MDCVEIDGKEYRIEYNFNAIAEFLEMTGRSLGDLTDLGEISAKEMLTLIWCGISEGERLEGRKMEIGRDELGAVIGPEDIKIALDILSKHFSGQGTGEDAKSGKQKKRIRWFSKK